MKHKPFLIIWHTFDWLACQPKKNAIEWEWFKVFQ